MTRLRLLLCCVLMSVAWPLAAQTKAESLEYTLRFPAPQTHYAEVEMRLNGIRQDYVDLRMAVWTPGSYLIREFAKNVDEYSATGDGKALPAEKISKNTWRIQTKGVSKLKFTYKVYAFELSVRTSFIDDSHALINGASIFVFPDGLQQMPSVLTIEPHAAWKEISTGLPALNGNKWIRKVENFDILVDSPIEIGNHTIWNFEVRGVPHEVALQGDFYADKNRLLKDMKRICETAIEVFGELPVKDYTFIINHIGSGGGGGLEHLNSTNLITTRFAYENESSYLGFLSLVAHEYFHLWNVKRLRPKPLGPFNYDAENYTSMLWFSEGFTSYYDDLLTYRAGYYTPNSYLNLLNGNIVGFENTAGKLVQSVAESSMDAWIKFYRPNENSNNSTVSYYAKGGIVGALLDIEIIQATKGQKSLDDLMRLLYEDFYKKKDVGITNEDFKAAFEKITGKKCDEFYADCIDRAIAIPYDKYLNYVGLQLEVTPPSPNVAVLGARTAVESNRLIIKALERGYAAYDGGLSVNDEIIAVDGYRVSDEAGMNRYVNRHAVGEKVAFTISRDNKVMQIDITLRPAVMPKVALRQVSKLTAEQQQYFNKWMGIR